jgi:hypothetical protein
MSAPGEVMSEYVVVMLVSSLVLFCAQAQAAQPYAPAPGVSALSVPALSVVEPPPPQGAAAPEAQPDALSCAAAAGSQPYVNEYGQISDARPLSILDCI